VWTKWGQTYASLLGHV